MVRYAFPSLTGAAVLAMMAAAGQAMAPAPRMIENRGQALPKGARKAVGGSRVDRRAMKKEAVKELMDMTRKTVVVDHLHPRWLRQAAIDMQQAGAILTVAAVDHLRSQGPEAARMIVEAYRGE